MPGHIWPRPWLPDRIEGHPDKVALLIPGNGYSPERPLLHFARAVFMKHGWTTQEIWWPERPPQPDRSDMAPMRAFATGAGIRQSPAVSASPCARSRVPITGRKPMPTRSTRP